MNNTYFVISDTDIWIKELQKCVFNILYVFSVGSAEGQSRCRSVRIEFSELKSFRITRNRQQLTLMQRDGTTHSAFFFQHGNADCFVNALKGNIQYTVWVPFTINPLATSADLVGFLWSATGLRHHLCEKCHEKQSTQLWKTGPE